MFFLWIYHAFAKAMFGVEGTVEDMAIFTAVVLVASQEEPKIRSPVIIVQDVDI